MNFTWTDHSFHKEENEQDTLVKKRGKIHRESNFVIFIDSRANSKKGF